MSTSDSGTWKRAVDELRKAPAPTRRIVVAAMLGALGLSAAGASAAPVKSGKCGPCSNNGGCLSDFVCHAGQCVYEAGICGDGAFDTTCAGRKRKAYFCKHGTVGACCNGKGKKCVRARRLCG